VTCVALPLRQPEGEATLLEMIAQAWPDVGKSGSYSWRGITRRLEGQMAFPTDDQIRNRAHQLWEQAGRPTGRDDEFWHQAERELREMDELREIANEPPPPILPG
jgi:Protein of unknown function (DUF2934)